MNSESEQFESQSDWLLNAVELVAISPREAIEIADRYKLQIRAVNPKLREDDVQDFAADAIIRRFSRWAATTGGATGLTGVIPGLGTIVAAVGGGAVDAVACMKLQVDMCMCLASNYGYDLNSTDARRLSFLIAATGSLNKFAGEAAKQGGSKMGQRLIQEYLKGAVLQAVKAAFRRLGLTFTRKALEKAIPFGVGVFIGASFNYGLSRYVGHEAKHWFIIDRSERGPIDGES